MLQVKTGTTAPLPTSTGQVHARRHSGGLTPRGESASLGFGPVLDRFFLAVRDASRRLS